MDSNLDGAELVFDSRLSAVPDEMDSEEARRTLRAAHRVRWLDSPLPALGDQSPRQAAALPHLVPLLWTLVHKPGEAALARELAMELPATE